MALLVEKERNIKSGSNNQRPWMKRAYATNIFNIVPLHYIGIGLASFKRTINKNEVFLVAY